MEKLTFRKLNADEIEVRIGQANKYGVSLLLYKDARCDQNILDECVGPNNWQRHHSRDNANCIVSIWDAEKKQWVEKEDTGKESFAEAEKGLASDSFKRACFNWGIGRELYTAPDMFVFSSSLKNLREKDGKFQCYDKFNVKSIEYVGDKISRVEIGISEKGKEYASAVFKNNIAETSTAPAPVPAPATATAPAPAPASVPTPEAGFADAEIILIGSCKGKKYGDVKNSNAFKSFVKWVKNTNTSYPDPKAQSQFTRFKKLEVV